ncbi:MAG: ParB/RepB/Spo0J family partition protein [Candidatus Binataceae bacterium]|nr:ParB/RepB/Spo0J family partition protein [Candidatus Binataceae bacterium]
MIRKPLGRGLAALIESGARGEGAAEAATLMMVAVEQIVPSPFQPRRYFDPDKLQELTEAIRAQGIIEPLIARPVAGDLAAPRYELIAGERRLRAARAAGMTIVPVVVREADDHAALELSLVENLVREDLNAIEEGRAFVRLNREFNLSHEEIAARIGKSRPYVSNTMRLLELPLPVVEMIARGAITPGQARPLLSIESADEKLAAAARISEGGISARGAEQMAADRKPAPRDLVARAVAAGTRAATAGLAPAPDANLGALADEIQRALRRKVKIARQHGRAPGRIEIEFYNDDDLTTVAQILIVAGKAVHGER